MNNSSAVFSETTLPSSFAMLQKVVDLLKKFVSSFITMFTLPHQLIQGFNTHWIFTCFVTHNTDDLMAPFFVRKPTDSCCFILEENLTTYA
jgi:hypothetical protein